MTVSLGYVIFYVSDVAKAVAFYHQVFGFSTKMVTPENDYGELATGTTTLAFVSNELAAANLSEAGGFTRLDSTGSPAAGNITLVTEDLQAAVARAVAVGAAIYVEPIEKPWGQTVAYLIDPQGILLEIATPVAGQ